MKKLLFMLDTDPVANTFDVVVGYDGGADVVTPYGGITPQNVEKMVAGTIFTRPPKKKHLTAIFVTGSNMTEGEELYKAVRKHMFKPFTVSVMLDSNGSNTTAAAAAALMVKHGSVAGQRAVILAGTGPVGQRAGVMLAREGAEVIITSRKLDRAEAACAATKQSFGVDLKAMEASDEASTTKALEGAHICFATGAAGIQLLSQKQWADHPTLRILTDANATPPLGIEGVDMMDKGERRNGKICYGAIGFGGLKIELQRQCVEKLFETNTLTLDAEEIYAIAKKLA